MAKKENENNEQKKAENENNLQVNAEINNFGEIKLNINIDQINSFLNKNVKDKKLKNNQTHDESES
ncbi:MAG: hypothetical protein EAZ55_02125 [Cytophagales bacterium]|nr:MAG: hypothetical protein EAZ55_02125 [Cytophagales bacterium]